MSAHLYAAGFMAGIVGVCVFVYVIWLDSQLKDARRQADQLRVQLAKAIEEREHIRTVYLGARYGRGRLQ